jgi:hypothetical protein
MTTIKQTNITKKKEKETKEENERCETLGGMPLFIAILATHC